MVTRTKGVFPLPKRKRVTLGRYDISIAPSNPDTDTQQPHDHIKRARNAFILFRKHITDSGLIPTTVESKHQNISVVVSASSFFAVTSTNSRRQRCGEKPPKTSDTSSKKKLELKRKNINESTPIIDISPSLDVPISSVDESGKTRLKMKKLKLSPRL
jgi:hypothetical protein